jgi:hypothetical protein
MPACYRGQPTITVTASHSAGVLVVFITAGDTWCPKPARKVYLCRAGVRRLWKQILNRLGMESQKSKIKVIM